MSTALSQGYLPLEASVLDVEVWGLGGRSAKEVQNANQKREDLFTEQRRKVTTTHLNSLYNIFVTYYIKICVVILCSCLQIDLKTFSNWEDSPEKMMMDMMSNPNTVRREER